MAAMHLLAFAVICALVQAADVFVMLALDTVTKSGDLKDSTRLTNQLEQLKSGKVDGIMVDVWWGVTEPSPKMYKFDAYKQLVGMCKDIGLKVQIVTSFHSCGGNVGDVCNISLPKFVNNQSDIWYKDRHGHEDKEYISLFADNVRIHGRTPLQMYGDWFAAFADAFSGDVGSVIVEMQIGMGPAGELRYPAYQLSKWQFCGVGAFQAYDTYALASLSGAAQSAGNANWTEPPSDDGSYNSRPNDASFFRDGYKSDYGKFFLKWYSAALLSHGHAVLSLAKAAFSNHSIGIAGKVAGIHWWYNSSHHAAELTAGYYNANANDAYGDIAKMFARSANASIDFTCMEMANSEQPSECESGPEELVRQVAAATKSHGIALGAENALPRFDDTAYSQILSYKSEISGFTFLRLSQHLLHGDVWNRFTNFVNQMHSCIGCRRLTVSVNRKPLHV